MTYAVIRVRGQPDVEYNIKHTMRLLGLTRVNHCIIAPETACVKGMLQVIKDYCTWGEIDEGTLTKLISMYGRIIGDDKITNSYIKEKSVFCSIDEVSKAIIEGNFRMKDIEAVKPIFRLHPPVKGYEGNKRSYNNGGALGYRGRTVNDLINRML